MELNKSYPIIFHSLYTMMHCFFLKKKRWNEWGSDLIFYFGRITLVFLLHMSWISLTYLDEIQLKFNYEKGTVLSKILQSNWQLETQVWWWYISSPSPKVWESEHLMVLFQFDPQSLRTRRVGGLSSSLKAMMPETHEGLIFQF